MRSVLAEELSTVSLNNLIELNTLLSNHIIKVSQVLMAKNAEAQVQSDVPQEFRKKRPEEDED